MLCVFVVNVYFTDSVSDSQYLDSMTAKKA